MKKLLKVFLFLVVFLALAVGTSAGQQGGQYVNGVETDQPVTQPAAPAPFVMPEGKYGVNGMLSDTPPLTSAPDTSVTLPQPQIIDGVLVDQNSEASPPFPDTGGALSQPNAISGSVYTKCAPSSLITINFDEQARPLYFIDTVALRYDYRANWLTFAGPGLNDGGAVLNGTTFGDLSGYSLPNFLAFNTQAMLGDGGIPKPPEQIYILPRASYVELMVGSPTGWGAGEVVTIEAFNDQGVSLGVASLTMTPAVQKLSVSAEGIYRLEIRTAAVVLAVDNVAYTPDAHPILVDYDDVSAPSGFIDTTALRDIYWMHGAEFRGPAPLDGGAILNYVSNFGVVGYSSPNFLAFNIHVAMSDGGIPQPPETINFMFPVSAVQLYVGGLTSAGTDIKIEAFNAKGASLGSATRALAPLMSPLTVYGQNITKIVITTAAEYFVVDDLIFIRQATTYIDFDESAQPDLFMNAYALRNTYQYCGALFNGVEAKDGGAVLDYGGGFSVTNFTYPNFLAFNINSQMKDGGIPKPPEEITFAHPVDSVQLYVGSSSSEGSDVTLQAFDKGGHLLGTQTVTLHPKLRILGFHHPGIAKVILNSPAAVFVVDTMNFHFTPFVFLPVVEKGK